MNHQIIELAQEYIKQNSNNVQQALNEIKNEIQSNEEEYRSLLQHQTDQSNLIIDLQQQSVQLQQDITQQIETLKTFNQNSENDPDLMLLEKIGFCKANLNKTENLLNKIKNIYIDFTILTNNIAEGQGLNAAQGQLTQMEIQIDEILSDTSQRYLKQPHVNQRCLPENIVRTAEQDVSFLKKYFVHFGQYRKALDQFMIQEAPLGLIAMIEAGNEANVRSYFDVLLTQEELQVDSLRGLFPRIAQEVINGMDQYLSYINIDKINSNPVGSNKNMTVSAKLQQELVQLRMHYNAIIKLQEITQDIDANVLQEHYRTKATRGYERLCLGNYLDFPKLLSVSLHYCVRNHLQKLINSEISQEQSQIALLLKDVLKFIQSYNDMVQELKIDYQIIRYAELTSNLQLISQQDVLGIRPHQFVKKELENILSPDILGQLMSFVIENDFYQQFKTYWHNKASRDDKKLILQSIQLQQSEKDIQFDQTFFLPVCRLDQSDFLSLLERQYKEYVMNKFDQVAQDQYHNYYKNVAQTTIRTNTFNDFLLFINNYYSALKINTNSPDNNQLQNSTSTESLKYYLSYAVNQSIICLLSSILNDLEIKLKPMNYQYLAGIVDQEQQYKNYFVETKQITQKKTNLEKIINQLPDPNFDYSLLKQRNLPSYKSKVSLLQKQKDFIYSNTSDLQAIAQHQSNFYLIIATDMNLFIQNFKMLDKDNNECTQDQDHKIKILANAILTHCVCKYIYQQILPLNTDFQKLYAYHQENDDKLMNNDAVWNVVFKYIQQVIQHFDSQFTEKNSILRQKFIDQIHLTLHACSYGNYLFKRNNVNNTDYDDELNRDCICLDKFCQQFRSPIAQNSIKILSLLRQPFVQSSFNEHAKKMSTYLILLYSSSFYYLEDILDFDFNQNVQQNANIDVNMQLVKQQAVYIQTWLLKQQTQEDFYHILDANPLERVFKNYALQVQ